MNLDEFPTRETAKDMMSMISPIYDRSYVGKWIFQIMALYISLAQETVKSLEDQEFPEKATWSIPYWEQSFGIPENPSLSLEERRKALILKKYSRKPMNPARIEQLLEELTGRIVHLLENVAPHTFQIVIEDGEDEVDLRRVRELLDRVKQSQKVYWIKYMQTFKIPVDIWIDVSLALYSGIEARSTKNFGWTEWRLDGEWLLNGERYLSGYLEDYANDRWYEMSYGIIAPIDAGPALFMIWKFWMEVSAEPSAAGIPAWRAEVEARSAKNYGYMDWYLDGRWKLDGERFLSGSDDFSSHASDSLYSVGMDIRIPVDAAPGYQTGITAGMALEPLEVRVSAGYMDDVSVEFPIEADARAGAGFTLDNTVKFAGGMAEGLEVSAEGIGITPGIGATGGAAFETGIGAGIGMIAGAEVSGIEPAVPKAVFTAGTGEDTGATLKAIGTGYAVQEETGTDGRTAWIGGVEVQNPEYAADLQINKLWYLDGVYTLDGSRKLDAGVYASTI